MLMKRILFSCLLLTATASFVYGQQANIGCVDKAILLKAQSVKQGLTQQGMEIYHDAMVGMESMEPYPIAVKLEKGHTYQLLYIGNADAAKITMELFDGDDKKLGEKSLMKGQQPGYIVYAFTPEVSDTYLIVLTQKLKNKSMCGSFTILDQNPDKSKTKPATAAPPKTNNNQPSNSNRYLGTPKKH